MNAKKGNRKMARISVDPRYVRTYANLKNLDRELNGAGIADLRHMIVWTETGRVTAVFIGNTPEITWLIHRGFMVVG